MVIGYDPKEKPSTDQNRLKFRSFLRYFLTLTVCTLSNELNACNRYVGTYIVDLLQIIYILILYQLVISYERIIDI